MADVRGLNRLDQELAFRLAECGIAAVAFVVVMFAAGALASGAGATGSAFPGRNGLIAFQTVGGIGVMKPSGRGVRLIVRIDHAEAPAWSADGSKLVFMVPKGVGGFQLAIVNADGSGERLLTNDVNDTQPSWSPDGRSIVFTDETPVATSDVAVVNVDGTGRRKLTDTPELEYLPAWSPDGSKIAYSGAQHCRDAPVGCTSELYVMNSDGSGARRLTFGNRNVYGAAWSPGGARIVFTMRDPAGGDALAVVPAAGGSVRRLTPFGTYYLPAWSPDGKRIVFQQGPPGAEDLWTMRPDGKDLRLLRPLPGAQTGPDWQPRR